MSSSARQDRALKSLVQLLLAAAPWTSYRRFNADCNWRGYAITVDPLTARATLPGIEYEHSVAIENQEELPAVIRTTTKVGAGPSDNQTTEYVDFEGVDTNADIDVDGSYSMEHSQGLRLALALTMYKHKSDADKMNFQMTLPHRTLEHSLAVSDDERRRCLLSYDKESGMLVSVLLLLERKGEIGNLALQAYSQTMLNDLFGTWLGDAFVRSPIAAPEAKKGFAKLRRQDAEKEMRKAVYKTQLRYIDKQLVVREIQMTGLDGETLDPITTIGRPHIRHSPPGEFVCFGWDGRKFTDRTLPTLLLLPANCHILAPLNYKGSDSRDRFADDNDIELPFSTEFGVVLEPGESFGWRGFQPSLDPSLDSSLDPEGDKESRRLIRISRLYQKGGEFASGTTSFCTTS